MSDCAEHPLHRRALRKAAHREPAQKGSMLCLLNARALPRVKGAALAVPARPLQSCPLRTCVKQQEAKDVCKAPLFT